MTEFDINASLVLFRQRAQELHAEARRHRLARDLARPAHGGRWRSRLRRAVTGRHRSGAPRAAAWQ